MTHDQTAFDGAPQTLAERLDWLFDKMRPMVPGDDGKQLPYSQTRRYHNNELARDLRVSASYVGQLRNGRTGNPTADVLRGIATFFETSATCLLGDTAEEARVEAEIEYRVALRRYEDGELEEPPIKPSPAGPHRLLGGEMPGNATALGERLSWLFNNVHSASVGRPHTDEEVAEVIGEKPWVVRGLRTGEMTDSDVSAAALRKLAEFFDLPLSKLLADDDHAHGADDELLDLLRAVKRDKNGLLGVALRSLESCDARHSGVRARVNQEVLAKLIRVHLEADEKRARQASERRETRPRRSARPPGRRDGGR